MNKIEEIIKLAGEEIKFDTPVKIKPTPHSELIGVYEIKTRDNEVWLRIHEGTFAQLEEKDRNYDMVANSLLQRLKILNHERNN